MAKKTTEQEYPGEVIRKAYEEFHKIRAGIRGFHPQRKHILRTYFALERLAVSWGVPRIGLPRPTEKAEEPKVTTTAEVKPAPVQDDPSTTVLADNADTDAKQEVKEYSRKRRTKRK